MENRLSLAKDFLRKESGIFVSIGNTAKVDVSIASEARLTILLNEIFNEKNYVATFVRKSGIARRQDIKHIATSQDFVLFYAKDINSLKVNKKKSSLECYYLEDEYLSTRGRYKLNKLHRGNIHYSESLDYLIKAP
jgi:adenine-specific DNA-methyltransferase